MMNEQIPVIILCGGKGTRMGTNTKHKSLFEIAGKPALFHLIETLNSLSKPMAANVLVVGAFAEQIMTTIGAKYENVVYTYQPEQKGTGNAT